MSKRWFLAAICLTACDDDEPTVTDCTKLSVSECGQQPSCQLVRDDGGPPRCGDERIGPRSCELMSVDECMREARCQMLDGRKLDEDRMCSYANEPKGCQARGTTCPPAVIYARAADLKTYEFVSGCWPLGWERVTPTVLPNNWPSCESSTAECAAHQPADCAKDTRCIALTGARIDESKQCVGEQQPLGCVARPLGCTAALVVARDAQDQRWWFSSGCIPAGYTAESSSPAVSWPQCNPVPPVVKACAALSGDECTRADCRPIDALGYDAARQCVRGRKNVGCMNANGGCTEFITYGRDREGQTWSFYDGCQPAGFTPFQPSGDDQPKTSWSTCAN